jgi:hypothetical protein
MESTVPITVMALMCQVRRYRYVSVKAQIVEDNTVHAFGYFELPTFCKRAELRRLSAQLPVLAYEDAVEAHAQLWHERIAGYSFAPPLQITLFD